MNTEKEFLKQIDESDHLFEDKLNGNDVVLQIPDKFGDDDDDDDDLLSVYFSAPELTACISQNQECS